MDVHSTYIYSRVDSFHLCYFNRNILLRYLSILFEFLKWRNCFIFLNIYINCDYYFYHSYFTSILDYIYFRHFCIFEILKWNIIYYYIYFLLISTTLLILILIFIRYNFLNSYNVNVLKLFIFIILSGTTWKWPLPSKAYLPEMLWNAINQFLQHNSSTDIFSIIQHCPEITLVISILLRLLLSFIWCLKYKRSSVSLFRTSPGRDSISPLFSTVFYWYTVQHEILKCSSFHAPLHVFINLFYTYVLDLLYFNTTFLYKHVWKVLKWR